MPILVYARIVRLYDCTIVRLYDCTIVYQPKHLPKTSHMNAATRGHRVRVPSTCCPAGASWRSTWPAHRGGVRGRRIVAEYVAGASWRSTWRRATFRTLARHVVGRQGKTPAIHWIHGVWKTHHGPVRMYGGRLGGGGADTGAGDGAGPGAGTATGTWTWTGLAPWMKRRRSSL